jgi:DNA-directed RNA polymerase subunit RPC12/RpoP
MVTNIISPGTDRYSAICTECGGRFSYERSDVHTNYIRGGKRVSCPHCGHSLHHFGASGASGIVWPNPHRRGDWCTGRA